MLRIQDITMASGVTSLGLLVPATHALGLHNAVSAIRRLLGRSGGGNRLAEEGRSSLCPACLCAERG
jgi:hypothetical protein